MPINDHLNEINCLHCRKVVELERATEQLRCPECEVAYPLFTGIPLLLNYPEKTIASAWLAHDRMIKDNGARLEEVQDALGRQPERAELLNQGIQAYERDNAYFHELQAEIETTLPKSEIDQLEKDGRLPKSYGMKEGIAFFYRDWCGSNLAENEISTILDTVTAQVESYADDVDSVLLPGTGAGRFACELACTYDSCFAFDYSLHMAQIFYGIVDRGVTLHRVNFRSNVVRTEDVVVEFPLSLTAPGTDRLVHQIEKGNLSYFVGDAMDVPLPGNSLSAVACIYFIDIVPVREQMNEVRRMLKPGGLFINFGPLRYMRGDVANMLSGEEILDLYRSSGFDILTHDIVPNTQLASSPVITSVHSESFMFVARKR